MNKCPHTDCVNAPDCAIIEITGKIPDSLDNCSYSKTVKQASRQAKKKFAAVDKKPQFKKKETWKAPKRKRELTND